MGEFLPMNAAAEMSFIVARLTDARKRANLTVKQADRRLSLDEGTIARFENHEVEPTLRMFLVLCQLYDVSPAWALTGIDPYIDAATLVSLIFATRSARNQLDEAYALSKQIPGFQDYESLTK